MAADIDLKSTQRVVTDSHSFLGPDLGESMDSGVIGTVVSILRQNSGKKVNYPMW